MNVIPIGVLLCCPGYLSEGGIGILGFAVLAIFLDRFFGFGGHFGLRIFRFLASGFRFS